jgi:DNA-directed RNA polymerase specialized sigma24 family protein
MTRQVTVELPEEATRAIKVAPEDLPRELREAAVLRWFEEGRLSQGQAAAVLGLTRGGFFDRLAAHRVSPVQMSAEELDNDFRRG